MSDSQSSTPLGPLFRAQRTLIEGTIETQRTLQRHGLELTRQSTKTIFGVLPGSDRAQEQVDETLDGIEETSETLLDDVQERADEGVDSAENVAETAANATEETADEVEAAIEETIDEASDTVEGAAETTSAAAEEVEAEAEDALDATEAAAEDTVQSTVERTEEAVEEAEEATEEAVETTDEPADPEGTPVGDLKGIGATYSARLDDAGFGTVEALADAPVAEVAEAAQVGEDRAAEWVERAQGE